MATIDDLPAASKGTTANGLPYPTADALVALFPKFVQALAEQLPQVAAGRAVSVAVAAGVTGTTHVNFPAGRFTQPPIVIVALDTDAGASYVNCYPVNVTATGFDLTYNRPGAALGAGVNFTWHAVQAA